MKPVITFNKLCVLKTIGFLLILCAANMSIMAENAATVKTKFVETGGRKIAYRSIGKGTPLILANRFRGNLDVWDPLFLDSLAKNFQVITFDYSGFGLSTGKPPTDILGFAKDVKDLAEALKFKKIIVGGWSFGGFVAQIVTTEFPEIVSHAVLIGTNPPGKNALGIEPIFFEVSRRPSYTVEDEAILFFEPKSEKSRRAAQASRDRIAQRKTDLDVRIPETLWDNYTKGGDDYFADPYTAREKMQQTKIPILLISGDHDVCFPIENWIALSRRLPTTQLIVFPHAGHGPQHEFPELTADYINNFIQMSK